MASDSQPEYLGPGDVVEPPPGVNYTRVLSGRGYNAVVVVIGLVGVAVMVLLASVVSQIIAAIGYVARGRPDGSFTAYATAALQFHYWEGMLAAHLGLAAMIPVAMLFVRFLHHRSPVWLTSVQPGMRWRFLILAVIAAIVLENAVMWLFGGGASFHYDPQPGWQGWLVLIVLVTPLQAAGEEYLFRGYLTQVLGSAIRNRWVSVVVSALIFAVAHGTGQDLSLFVNRFAFGLVMGVVVIVTGGLEASIAAHAVNNVFSFGYAALSTGGVASAMGLTTVSWATTGWNVLAYALVGLAAWTIGTRLHIARTTPAS